MSNDPEKDAFSNLGSLFLCPHCGSSLMLTDILTEKMVALLQCHMCRHHFHTDVLVDSEGDYQFDTTIRTGTGGKAS